MSTDTWHEGPAINGVRGGCSSVYVDGTIYTIGGYGSVYYTTTEVLQFGGINPPSPNNRLYVLLNISESTL